MYNAFCVVDITGGMGITTVRKMQELGYKNLYVDGVDTTNVWAYNPKAQDKIPGINFNNKRVQIIAAFEEYVRHKFKIRSTRLYNEMNTFIYINGRPEHQKGHHDDLRMALSMATYVAETSFSSLTKVTEQTKAMLNSWSVSNNETVTQIVAFNPTMPNINERRDEYGSYAVEGTPAQVVQHGLFEIAERPVDLVVSGINYGENLGEGVTVSGTIGAALESAPFRVPSLAISLETSQEHHYSLSDEIDFSTSAHFLQLFARRTLELGLPLHTGILKVEIPSTATPQTEWRWTRLSQVRYFLPVRPHRRRPDDPGPMGYAAISTFEHVERDSDVWAVLVERKSRATRSPGRCPQPRPRPRLPP